MHVIHYDEKRHPFWASAFADTFGGGKDAEGRLIMKVNEIGTSQEAIGAYCEHLRDKQRGLTIMEAIFSEAAQRSPQEGREALDHMSVIGALWDNPDFAAAADSILSNYVDITLYRTEIPKDRRLEEFITRNQPTARVVWEGIFDSRAKREALAVQLEMPIKRWGAFRRCETIDDLAHYLQMLRGRKDPLPPPHLVQRRDRASDRYERAVRGNRIGLMGWYWNSEEIDMATAQLRAVNQEIRDWLMNPPKSSFPKRTRASLSVA